MDVPYNKDALKTWAKDLNNIEAVQKVFDERSKMNSLAAKGEWKADLENADLKLKKIYLITPNLLNKKFYFYLPKVLATRKIKFLQIRCKKYSSKTIEGHINKIIKICSKFNVKLIINDDSSFVNKHKNIGFHLGQSDLKRKK